MMPLLCLDKSQTAIFSPPKKILLLFLRLKLAYILFKIEILMNEVKARMKSSRTYSFSNPQELQQLLKYMQWVKAIESVDFQGKTSILHSCIAF